MKYYYHDTFRDNSVSKHSFRFVTTASTHIQLIASWQWPRATHCISTPAPRTASPRYMGSPYHHHHHRPLRFIVTIEGIQSPILTTVLHRRSASTKAQRTPFQMMKTTRFKWEPNMPCLFPISVTKRLRNARTQAAFCPFHFPLLDARRLSAAAAATIRPILHWLYGLIFDPDRGCEGTNPYICRIEPPSMLTTNILVVELCV